MISDNHRQRQPARHRCDDGLLASRSHGGFLCEDKSLKICRGTFWHSVKGRRERTASQAPKASTGSVRPQAPCPPTHTRSQSGQGLPESRRPHQTPTTPRPKAQPALHGHWDGSRSQATPAHDTRTRRNTPWALMAGDTQGHIPTGDTSRFPRKRQLFHKRQAAGRHTENGRNSRHNGLPPWLTWPWAVPACGLWD